MCTIRRNVVNLVGGYTAAINTGKKTNSKLLKSNFKVFTTAKLFHEHDEG